MGIVLTLSTIIGIRRTQWIAIWVCLEINSLSICMLISTNCEKDKSSNSSAITYYLVQILTSLIILLFSRIEKSLINTTIVTRAILIKIGVWPIHTWYIKIISLIEIKQIIFIILITWQKILPIVIIIIVRTNKIQKEVIFTISLVSIISPIQNLNKSKSVKRIIGLSSLNNNGWLVIRVLTSILIRITFLAIYSLSLWVTLKTAWIVSTKNIIEKTIIWEFSTILGNMGGLPPIIIFWAKVIIIKFLLAIGISPEVCLLIIITACYFLYHYLFMGVNRIALKPTKDRNPSKNFSYPPKLIPAGSLICMTTTIL